MSTAKQGGGRQFPARAYGLVLLAIFLIAIFPAIPAFLAYLVGSAASCDLSKGLSNPCMIIGQDWSDGLYVMFSVVWLFLLTVPLGGAALVGWLVVLVIHRLTFRSIVD